VKLKHNIGEVKA